MRWNWQKSATLILLMTMVIVLTSSPLSLAQDYSFSLDREVVDVWVNQDGSITIEYAFTFTVDQGAHPIDVVDLGLPNGNYDPDDISGNVDGTPIESVDRGDYQGDGEHGVAVWLGAGTIQPGQTGTVNIRVDRVGQMLYQDSDDPDYASIEFSPTWFGSSVSHGTTDMTVYFHLPAGVEPEEPRWHRSPSGWPQSEPETALDEEGRVVYIWQHPQAQPDRQYIFGASFPREDVEEGVVQQGPSAIEQVFSVIGDAAQCCCNPVVLFLGFFAGIAGLAVWGNRRRKMKYLPPSLKIEGAGIKRGLTAIEAAILLERPLNKVLSMILFSLLKKGAVVVESDDPLKVKAREPQPGDLRPYEETFLEAIKADQTLSEKKLRKMVVDLIKQVNNKMKGFSRKETIKYYQTIVEKAWTQVEKAQTPEVRSERFDERMEWTMLDDDFDDRMDRTFRGGPVFVPTWWPYYRPWASRTRSSTSGGGRSTGGTTPSTGRVQLPTLPGATFAATMVNGVQDTASRIVRNVTGFTSGVTQVTNPPPKTSSGHRYSSGGSSCACACACAGCACACAGGGR